VIWPPAKGSAIWWDYKPRGARAINRVRDLVAEGDVGKVLSCTMIVTTPGWGTDFGAGRAKCAMHRVALP